MYNKPIIKAVGSKREFFNENDPVICGFMDCIRDLLEIPEVKELDNFHQHCNTSLQKNLVQTRVKPQEQAFYTICSYTTGARRKHPSYTLSGTQRLHLKTQSA